MAFCDVLHFRREKYALIASCQRITFEKLFSSSSSFSLEMALYFDRVVVVSPLDSDPPPFFLALPAFKKRESQRPKRSYVLQLPRAED